MKVSSQEGIREKEELWTGKMKQGVEKKSRAYFLNSQD